MKICTIIIFLLFAQVAGQAQFTLRGKIVASDTKANLAGASVFLSNTSVGTLTNSAGEFTLNIPSGKYDLIASFIGYETSTQTLTGTVPAPVIITLKPKAELIDEVVIDPFDKDGWKNWGQFFIDNFIGTSEGAADCKFENHEVLKFRNNKKENKLYAVATDQLVIVNRSLGYKVTYQMEEFQYDFKSRFLLYVGYPLFTPLDGNAAKQRRWKKKREEAYQGSLMNFMRAVYRNQVVEEGFEVRRLVKEPNLEKQRVRAMRRPVMVIGNRQPQPSPSSDSSDYFRKVLEQPDELLSFSPYTLTGDSIAYAIDSVTAGLVFPNYLHITYKEASPPDKYRRLSPQNNQMRSELKLMDVPGVSIQSSGHYYPAVGLVTLGYWAWSEKMADMLPFDYKPGN